MSKISNKKRQNRRIILTLILVFTLWMIWGNYTIQVSHFTISDYKIPESFNGYKIAHVSDLHNHNWDQRLIESIKKEQANIIVITGDLIDSQKVDLDIALDFVNHAQTIAPVYYVTGNQEAVSDKYDRLKSGLLERGATILEDEVLVLEESGAEILLLGIHDPLFMIDRYPMIELPENVNRNLQEMTTTDNIFKILLSHRPELFELYVQNDIDLVLSGHAHGGQFRLPFIGGVYAPDQGFFPKYTTGIYSENYTSMVVSRGLGNSVIPFRFNNRPELVFVELETK